MTNDDRLANARELYEERAAICEFDGLQPRAEAEQAAKIEVANWLKAHRIDLQGQG